ncbi:MAG TPA: thiamine-phosphate kinase [Oceanospirillaceae bacterium]|nr:thiamine-phosphate kinase [Oceanospirillaceae bacterium]
MSSTGEFDLIKRYFQRPQLQAPVPMALGPGDDCALLDVLLGQQLAVSADTLVAGIHFLAAMPAAHIAQRCLAANLSDLAAMGAKPAWFTLCLTLPSYDEAFLQGFSDGLVHMAQTYGIALAGGDTTRGPLAISIQVMGWVPAEQALKRNGAQVGDDVYVSGYLGDAAGGLACIHEEAAATSYLAQRFYNPTPRLTLGQWLLGKASAAIDVSDGLLQDLGHILSQSQVGATLDLEQLPISNVLAAKVSAAEQEKLALAGGEDFELCFTIPPQWRQQVQGYARQHDLPVSRIGHIEPTMGLRLQRDGQSVPVPDKLGWQHF